MIYIGIDPGSSGGIAITDGELVQAWKLPVTERDTFDLFRELSDPMPHVAIIEAVGPMPGQGVTGMFAFGRSYGFLRGLLVALGVPFEEVRPQQWQKVFGLIQKGQKLSQTEKKNRNKAKAQQLWPHLKITHATADALLIAEYGRRVNANRV